MLVTKVTEDCTIESAFDQGFDLRQQNTLIDA